MHTNRRSILKMLSAAAAGLVVGPAAVHSQSTGSAGLPPPTVYEGTSLNCWEIALGDALFNGNNEAPVSLDDIKTIHYLSSPKLSYSELLANVQRRVIQAHNITFYRIIKDTALDYVHTCGYKFMLPYTPQPDPAAEFNGQTIEGGIFVWDGSKSKKDYGIAFQWDINAWINSGDINVWTGTGWERVGSIDLASGAEKWHEVRMRVDFPRKQATLTIDGKSYQTRFTATEKLGWGPETAARFQAEIVSVDPLGGGLSTLHRAFFRDWYWVWDPPKVRLPIILNQPTSTPTSTPTATATPTPTVTPIPTPKSCGAASVTAPQPNQTVNRPFGVCWVPSNCEMVLQAYQDGRQQPVYENKRAKSCTQLGVNDIQPGLTELKIWVPGASSPADSIWVTIL